MQKLQLYIEGQRIDLFKDETVSITQTIQNVKDIDKIFTSFTKTFSVPASKVNNKIFKHYYNYDIVNGFDARLKKPAEIQLNTIPFKTGRIKLEGVDLKNNLPYLYKITFFGNTVELPDVLGDDKLGSLAFAGTDYDLTYSPLEVENYLKNDLTATNPNIIVPLITHTQRLFYDSVSHINGSGNLYAHGGGGGSNYHGVKWDELKYAVRLYAIIEEIETRYSAANGYPFPITFSRDFFNENNPEFNNLYMWLHRKSGSVEPASQVTSFISPIGPYTATNPTAIVPTGNGFFVSNFYIENPNGITSWEINFTTQNTTDPYRLIISLNGTTVYTSPFEVTGSFNFNQNPPLVGNGTYTISVQHSEVIVFDSVVQTFDGFVRLGGVTTQYTDVLTATNVTAQKVFNFVVPEQIPDFTIMSFLTGLFKTFNLVAYVNDAGTIVVRPLEAKAGTADYSYYTSADIDGNDEPITYDISSYIDVTKSQVNVALPYREIKYTYAGLGTYLAKQHEQLSGYGWGSLTYIGGTNSDGTGGINYNAVTKVYNVSVPFEHMKYERLLNADNGAETTVQWGYSVNENQQPYIGQPLIFYGVHQTGAGVTTIRFLEDVGNFNDIDSYWIPSNSLHLNAVTGTQNINFGLELNEYTGGNGFDETLFNDYHSEYIIDVFNVSRRITKVSAILPLRILYNFKLNDTFTINSRNYIINSITTNLQTGKSDMELLNDFNLDTINPSPPTNLVQTGSTSSSITFSWTESTDNKGVEGYKIYLNNIFVGTSATPPKSLGGLSSSTAYLVRLVAYDYSGNESISTGNVTMFTSS